MNPRVKKFREARNLTRLFPERYRLWAEVLDGNFLWALFERKDFSPKWEMIEESHDGLMLMGWNVDLKKVHGFERGCYQFIWPQTP